MKRVTHQGSIAVLQMIMRSELGTVGCKGDSFYNSSGDNIRRTLRLAVRGELGGRVRAEHLLQCCCHSCAPCPSLKSDVSGSCAGLGVQSSQKAEVMY